ncbi:type IV toxin-antitoxin system AbiEi family antitoxin domain-containing protein [Nocardia sp. XZ_19_385]|uniref:type IV toxin-antitoxin system AbiEi family antitoxin domain-containing protein n=1 Tax=Nocardia sp. XZ_19_385 TaxID=2769488 RepID=UPI00189066F9|nr:type IV toxin-antitoxin system AbiEi family antitoxin domain-containing protein [Nocardia sp. XZ_19_385]
MRPGLEEVRDKQFGVFTTAQVLREYTRSELRGRLERGEWVRVFHAVYRESEIPPSPQLRVEAARLSMGVRSLTAAYNTAAELHGFSVLDDPATHVLGVQASRVGQLIVHRHRVDPGELQLAHGTRTTNPVRTTVDMARRVSRLDALAVLDAALRHGISREALAAAAKQHRRRPGIRQAAELIEMADARAESPMESRTRLRCIDAGLPHPQPQFRVWTATGPRRLDLGWPAWQIGLEYDSAAWHSGPHAAHRDFPRHNALATAGWRIYYATGADVYHHPHHFTDPIYRAMAAARTR